VPELVCRSGRFQKVEKWLHLPLRLLGLRNTALSSSETLWETLKLVLPSSLALIASISSHLSSVSRLGAISQVGNLPNIILAGPPGKLSLF
jgi:hypothetical protein